MARLPERLSEPSPCGVSRGAAERGWRRECGARTLRAAPPPRPAGATGSRSVRVRIEGSGEAVRAEAFDVLGRSVGVLHDGAVAGTVEASLPAGLTAGAYVVRVSAAGRTTSHAVVVR